MKKQIILCGILIILGTTLFFIGFLLFNPIILLGLFLIFAAFIVASF